MLSAEDKNKVRQQKVVLRRLRAIDSEIRSGTYPNTAELAKKLEVGVRTISRDLDELRLFYNAPIEFDRAKNGYYYTEDSFYIKDVSLSEGELFSIALFERLLLEYRNTPLENHLKSVFRKITESLGTRISIDSTYLNENITYISEPLPQIDTDVFNKIFYAVRDCKTITFDYRPLQKQTFMNRTVKPYHIVCQKGSWYVIGHDNFKNAVRIFSFSRIKNIKFTGEDFLLPDDFDWKNYIDSDFGVWASEQEKEKITLRFSSEIATFAIEHIWTKNQTVTQNPDGSVDVSFETSQLSEIKRFVLGQGHTVKVLENSELMKAVKMELKETLKIYENS
ncbi:MAG: WYL domain-containing protein [Spirochaetia bacterium]|nr:WYL domain-containing protein [Spirochaetia bacterium]